MTDRRSIPEQPSTTAAPRYTKPTGKAYPCIWVVEKDAADIVPMMIDATTFDPARHVKIDEDGHPVAA